ncbi:22298_t:CDS:1, partial [Racocetra persica]
YVIDITQNNIWSGYKEPYITKNLNEVLQLPEKQPSLIRIKEIIKDLEVSRRDIQKEIKELKASDARIEEEIKKLKNH